MTECQLTALAITDVWLLLVGLRFQKSPPVLLGGLMVVGLYAGFAVILGSIKWADLGMAPSSSWWPVLRLTAFWFGVMLAYSPWADRFAWHFMTEKPNLKTFRALQDSRAKLAGGIVVAWVLGWVSGRVGVSRCGSPEP